MGIFDIFKTDKKADQKPDIVPFVSGGDVDGLIGLVKYKQDWQVRKAAIAKLLRLRDARSIRSLELSLGDENEDVRKIAAASLGAILILGRIEAMQGGASPLLLLNAGSGSGDMWRVDAKEYQRSIESLLRALKDRNQHVRTGAAIALAITRDKTATSHLGAASDDPQVKALLDNRPTVTPDKLRDMAVALWLLPSSGTQPRAVRVIADLLSMGFDDKYLDNAENALDHASKPKA